MKKIKEVVINECFGGFSLSPLAVQKLAERKGKECFFFEIKFGSGERYIPISLEEAEKTFMWFAYSVPNPQDYKLSERDKDGLYVEADKRTEQFYLSSRFDKRDDPDLVKVIKELGEKANGKFAKLKIVKIPAEVKYVIDEYDGLETIHEEHRSWS